MDRSEQDSICQTGPLIALFIFPVMKNSHPHPFISILNYSKGKKVIPRVLRHLLPEQTLTLLTMLVANFESLNVCKSEVYADVQGNQEIELFMNTIVPPLLGFVSEAPFRIVVGLLALFIERNNMVWVARSKVKHAVRRERSMSKWCKMYKELVIDALLFAFVVWFGLPDPLLEPR